MVDSRMEVINRLKAEAIGRCKKRIAEAAAAVDGTQKKRPAEKYGMTSALKSMHGL